MIFIFIKVTVDGNWSLTIAILEGLIKSFDKVNYTSVELCTCLS